MPVILSSSGQSSQASGRVLRICHRSRAAGGPKGEVLASGPGRTPLRPAETIAEVRRAAVDPAVGPIVGQKEEVAGRCPSRSSDPSPSGRRCARPGAQLTSRVTRPLLCIPRLAVGDLNREDGFAPRTLAEWHAFRLANGKSARIGRGRPCLKSRRAGPRLLWLSAYRRKISELRFRQLPRPGARRRRFIATGTAEHPRRLVPCGPSSGRELRRGVIHQERAAGATLFPIGPEHEVIRGQLAAAVEELREAQFALRTGEDIILLDLGPGKFLTLASKLVAEMRQLFFLGQEIRAGPQPFRRGRRLYRRQQRWWDSRGWTSWKLRTIDRGC